MIHLRLNYAAQAEIRLGIVENDESASLLI